MSPDPEVIYSERTVSRPIAISGAIVFPALAAFGFFFSTGAFIVGLFGGVVLLVLVSNNRYHGLTLDTTTLTVGRGTVELDDLDPGFGVQRATDVLDGDTRRSLEVTGANPGSQMRFLGGSSQLSQASSAASSSSRPHRSWCTESAGSW